MPYTKRTAEISSRCPPQKPETPPTREPGFSNPRLLLGSKDKCVSWYTPTLTEITPAQRDLLENYSRIPPDQVHPHIIAIRDRAWEIHPYPCIGQFRFLDLTTSTLPNYPSLLTRLISGATFLDLGCCLAQDLRKLVHDGAPASNLWGAELNPEFIEVGYALFLDRATFGGHLVQGDVFEPEGELGKLEGKMDIVSARMFLHLFDWEGQVRACERIVKLARQGKGALVIGAQVGSVVAGEVKMGRDGKCWRHDVESFERLWREVGKRTGSEWVVRASLDRELMKRGWDSEVSKRLVFEVERVKS